MNLDKEDLERAASHKIITEEQASTLWEFLQKSSISQTPSSAQFKGVFAKC